jgi:hypothetical protein
MISRALLFAQTGGDMLQNLCQGRKESVAGGQLQAKRRPYGISLEVPPANDDIEAG